LPRILNQLRFAQEIREGNDLKLPAKSDVKEKEIDMALNLIEQLTTKFDPHKYKDTYTEELKEIIAEKAKGKTPKRRGKAPKNTEVGNLMDMLKASLDEYQAQEKATKPKSKTKQKA
jgi:DNA end-binding protein Ku